MESIHAGIVACYLYVITKYGYPPPAKDTPRHLIELKALGFKSVELEGIRKEHLEEMYALRNQIKTDAETLDLKIPVFCIVLPGLSSPDTNERQQNLELFEKGCQVAEYIGAISVLDNAPIPPWSFPKGIPVSRHFDEKILANVTIPRGLQWHRYWEVLIETYRAACDLAAQRGLDFHLHPCYGALVHSTDAFLLFAENVKRDNLRFNLDTANQFFMKDNLFLSLLRLKDHIDYIHLSDNRGYCIEHLPACDGTIEWDKFFEGLDRIGFNGIFGIDVGGAETGIEDLDAAYRTTAAWLTEKWFNKRT
ncbi:MAG: sugar phosphate isomerase/epimerase [Candidatus Cloacimonetes bacterium]|nr:sugar phosphate isomerase/epimerase [Candidatus Cloacimonadota bacterium]